MKRKQKSLHPKVPCASHLARTGRRVAAFAVVNGEPMCRPCYAGKPIVEMVEESGVFRGWLPGYNSVSCGVTPPKKRHFVSNRLPKPVGDCR